MSTAGAQQRQATGVVGFLQGLHNIKLGGGGGLRASRRELAGLIGNLSTLMENGVSLTHALETLSQEKSLKKFKGALDAISLRLRSGESFSGAMRDCPIFSELIVNQVRVGERSGTVPQTLARIATQLESANELMSKVLKKLSYPLIVATAGLGVVLFMLMFVVPKFEETYQAARIPLPTATRILMTIGHFTLYYGWIIPVGLVAGVLGIRHGRKNENFALWMDSLLIRIPIIGDWLRDMAVFQFMEVLGVMLDSGFRLMDALASAGTNVGNYAVRAAVQDLKLSIARGERLSRELDKHGHLFPPIVSQLVIVGEKTGNIRKSAHHVVAHLRKQIERKTEIMVATLEPILTISMAVGIGLILLAIYMPMFSMVDTVDAAAK